MAVVPGGRGTVLLLLCAETTSLCSSLPHFCFGFLSSVSQTNLPLLFLVPLCFSFSLLYTRNPPSSVLLSFGFFFSPPSLVSSPFFVFIAKRRESPPCLVPSRRRRETRLPYPCRVRWPVVCRAWVVLMVAGWGWLVSGFCGQVGREGG